MRGPVQPRPSLWLSVCPPVDQALKIAPDRIGEIVAHERSGRTGDDDEQETLVAGTGGHAAQDHCGLARNDRKDRVEERDRKDDQQEPPVA